MMVMWQVLCLVREVFFCGDEEVVIPACKFDEAIICHPRRDQAF